MSAATGSPAPARARPSRLLERLVLAAALAGATVPGHAQEGVYRAAGPQLPVALASNGHTQEVSPQGDGTLIVRVAVSWRPIGSRGPAEDGGSAARALVPTGFSVPPALARRLEPQQEAWEAATEVLEWVAHSLRLDGDDRAPQDAASVLARRRGRCSGVANAAAALLLAAGLEARTVSGVLMDGDRPVPHRWVECRLPGVGWVATDPTLGLWTVTPRHIAFADTVTAPPTLEVLRLDEAPLDVLPRRRGLPVRPNRGAELVVRAQGDGWASWPVAVLRGPAGETHRALLHPAGRFPLLLPGRWQLRVEQDGAVVEQRQLDLRPETVLSLAVERPRASSLGPAATGAMAAGLATKGGVGS